jgi:hypothetical protein
LKVFITASGAPICLALTKSTIFSITIFNVYPPTLIFVEVNRITISRLISALKSALCFCVSFISHRLLLS